MFTPVPTQVDICAGVVGIEPAAAALRAGDPAEPAHRKISFVLALAAPARAVGIACLGAHPDLAEDEGLAGHVIPALVVLLVPLGVLQDDLDSRSLLPGGSEDTVPRDARHQVAAKPAP
jgi:hypothetical protein